MSFCCSWAPRLFATPASDACCCACRPPQMDHITPREVPEEFNGQTSRPLKQQDDDFDYDEVVAVFQEIAHHAHQAGKKGRRSKTGCGGETALKKSVSKKSGRKKKTDKQQVGQQQSQHHVVSSSCWRQGRVVYVFGWCW